MRPIRRARQLVPSVPVPHLADQFYWAHLLHQRHASSPPLPRGLVTGATLATRVRQALQPGVGAAAQRLGESVRREDGTGSAVDYLEGVLRGPRSDTAQYPPHRGTPLQ